MQDRPQTGHDGPYDAPVVVGPQRVLPEWIDYNGHMNVAYYTLAVDTAFDDFLEHTLGVGAQFVERTRMGPYALQANYTYLGEMLEGDQFTCRIRLLDHDQKRLHLLAAIVNAKGETSAIVETLLINVDLDARKSTPYPDWAVARFAAMKTQHSKLPEIAGQGAVIGIRRR